MHYRFKRETINVDFYLISTTNLAACVCAKFDQFLPSALILTPNVPKILFA